MSGSNEAAAIVGTYNQLRILSKLGMHINIEDVPCYMADCFVIIESEVSKLVDELQKKKPGARRGK